MAKQEDWITTREGTELSGYSAVHLRDLMRLGRIEGRKIATVWLISRSSLLKYLKVQSERGEKRGRKALT